MQNVTFADMAIVSCGTMRPELKYLQQDGFLDTPHLYFTRPGLHENYRELERQLTGRISSARKKTNKIIVVYGGKFCYVNGDEPARRMKTIIEEQGASVVRIDATHCVDMLADAAQRRRIAEEIAGGEKIWWMTPGWIQFRHYVFNGWDRGLANENFPRHTGGAVVLDGVGYVERYMSEHPEEFLEYSDWMGIPLMGYSLNLDRLRSLLADQARNLSASAYTA
jgi:hypothetical protein